MANYNVNNALGGTPQNMSSSFKSIVMAYASNATALRRGKIYDFFVGVDGTPADNAMVWDISRMTAAGTATTVTPPPLDPADSAMLGVGSVNATAEPTITANSSVFNLGVNQRASYRWVAAPGGELVYPATNANGLALRCKSAAYASTVTGDVMVQEQ